MNRPTAISQHVGADCGVCSPATASRANNATLLRRGERGRAEGATVFAFGSHSQLQILARHGMDGDLQGTGEHRFGPGTSAATGSYVPGVTQSASSTPGDQSLRGHTPLEISCDVVSMADSAPRWNWAATHRLSLSRWIDRVGGSIHGVASEVPDDGVEIVPEIVYPADRQRRAAAPAGSARSRYTANDIACKNA